MTSRSIQVPAFHAASTPIGIATATETISVAMRQRDGRLDPLLDQLGDRQVGEDRDAEIAVQQPPHPGAELDVERPSSPSLARMRAMSSTVAVSPAMIAAGSPGLRCSSAKTNSATTAMTGIVARMRRTT